MRKAAKEVGLGYGAIREMVHTGALRLIVLPGRKAGVVDLDDVDRLIDEGPGESRGCVVVPMAGSVRHRQHR